MISSKTGGLLVMDFLFSGSNFVKTECLFAVWHKG